MEEILSSSRNSFLDEIDRNLNISSEIRREIELRYQNSLVNKTYKFPRVMPDNSKLINNSLILFKKKGHPTLNKVQTLSSIYVPNNLNRKLPDLSRKITMKNTSHKLLDTNSNLSSSYVFIPSETLKVNKKIASLNKKPNKTFKIRYRSMKKFINL